MSGTRLRPANLPILMMLVGQNNLERTSNPVFKPDTESSTMALPVTVVMGRAGLY